jgi:hypothetical protein
MALAAVLAAGAAGATTYDFSYTFATGETISGSFYGDGVVSGGVTTVTDIGGVTASLDGTSLAGPLYAFSYTDAGGQCGSCYAPGGATVSSDVFDNNFAFLNSTKPGSLSGYTNYFYIIPWPNGGGNPEATQFFNANATYTSGNNGPGGNYLGYYNGALAPGNWSLSAAAPEPGGWALMLAGVGLVGAVLRRRQAPAKPAA